MVEGCFLGKLLEDVSGPTLMTFFHQPNTFIELESNVEFEAGFTATSILHPATYLNKVLVASSQGAMQLWNLHSQ
jgi:hypothetical protein